MANLNLNLQQYNFQQAFEQMPAGWYPAIIKESEVVETSKKDGFRLVLTFEIIDGQYKGRKVMSGYNIQNPNPKAVEIAMSELKTIAASVGVFATLAQSEQLHNIPLQIRLVTVKDSEYNEVKGYKTIQGEDPGKQGQAAPQAPVAQPAQGFGNPPQQAQPYGPPPTQQPVYEQPQQAAPPAWAQPQQAPQFQAPPQVPAQFQPPALIAPVAAPAAPAWAPQQPAQAGGFQPPSAPAWSPNPAPPQAPSWGRQ